MKVAITGTPGTGKTTVASELADSLDRPVVHLGSLLEDPSMVTGRDPDRGSVIADIDALEEWIADRDDVLVESHLAHHLPVDRVVVLRCAPVELERRLRDRDMPPASVSENAESEALDLVLAESVERHGAESVYEIDTTDRDPAAVASDVEAVVHGGREPAVGTVDFIDYLT